MLMMVMLMMMMMRLMAMMMCLFQLVVIDVYNHRFHKVFMMSESLTHITERDDIYV